MSTARRGLASLIHTYLGTFGRTVIQFALGVLLARLLSPETFGLVAIAWIVVGFGNAFADAGLTSFIIQRKQITPGEVAQAFWSQLVLGAAISLLTLMFSPALAQTLGDTRATPILQFMSSLFFLRAMGQTSYALMARDGKFGTLQVIGVATYFFGYGFVAVGMALGGLGPWSIVAAAITQTLASTIIQVMAARPSLRLIRQWPIPTAMYGFGAKATTSGFLGLLLYNIDNIAISRAMGTHSLGIYNRCINLVSMPTQVVNQLNSVILAFASKVQDRKDLSATIYLSMNTIYAATIIPMMLVIASFPETVILGLYGSNWVDAIPVLRPMALAICFSTLAIPCGAILMSLDRTSLEIRAQLMALACLIGLGLAAGMLTLEYFAWGIVGVYLVRFLFSVVAVRQELPIPLTRMMASTVFPATVSVFPVLFCLALRLFWIPETAELALLSTIVASAIGLLLGLFMLGPFLAMGPVSDLLLRTGRLPAPITRWLNISSRWAKG